MHIRPHQSLEAIKANKTGPHDAARLAQLPRTGFARKVHVESPTSHGVCSVITARAHMVEARVRLGNAIRSPACKALMSIPGVGVPTSAVFVAAVDEAGRFKRWRSAGTYIGPVPRRHQSSELDWTGRITKQGE